MTKAQPKEMLPLVDKPVIQYSVEEAVAAGAELVIIVTASGKRSIEDHFDRSFELECLLEQRGDFKALEEVRRLSRLADICYVRQKEQLGLGHAVLQAAGIVGDEPFMLFLPDDLFEHGDQMMSHMLAMYQDFQSSILAVRPVPPEDVCRYGVIGYCAENGRTHRVLEMVEKPRLDEAPSNLAIMGRYVLTPDVFDILRRTPRGRGGEIQLTDALQRLLQRHPIYAYEFGGKYYDVGTPAGWLETTMTLALQHPAYGPRLRAHLQQLLDEEWRREAAPEAGPLRPRVAA